MSKQLITLLAGAGLFVCGQAMAADGISKDAYKAEKDSISATYKADKEKCSSLKGNAKDVCEAEAKGNEKTAKAEAEAKYKNTASARRDARKARVEADYKIAKEKCDDLSGDQKSACIKEAKAAEAKGKADLKNVS